MAAFAGHQAWSIQKVHHPWQGHQAVGRDNIQNPVYHERDYLCDQEFTLNVVLCARHPLCLLQRCHCIPVITQATKQLFPLGVCQVLVRISDHLVNV